MKNKVLTKKHFEYLDNITKILGFKNLADYKTIIIYKQLQTNQTTICKKINLTIDDFKKMFHLDYFDLRKIQYTFENIDQVIGFVKKLFFYLNVPLEYENKSMRLIPQNILYNEYIKMLGIREIPQINEKLFFQPSYDENMTQHDFKKMITDFNKPSKTIEDYKSYKEILDETDSTEMKEKFIIYDGVFDFSHSKIDYIETINIDMLNTNMVYNLKINFGNNLIFEQIIDKYNHLIQIGLPNLKNLLSQLSLRNNFIEKKINNTINLTQLNHIALTITGKKFNTQPKYKYIKFDHDSTFYNFDQIYVFEADTNYTHNVMQYKLVCQKAEQIYFSSLLKYLKMPQTHLYIAENIFHIPNVNFKYIYDIKISKCLLNSDNIMHMEQLETGTTIEVCIGGNVYMQRTILDDTKFVGNMYVLKLNLPNNYFYQYNDCRIKINSPSKCKYCFDITGSDLKKSFPERVLNCMIEFDHDENWYQPNKFVLRAFKGLIGDCVLAQKNNEECKNELLLQKLYTENKIGTSNFIFEGINFKSNDICNIKDDNVDITMGLNLLSANNDMKSEHNCVSINDWSYLIPHMKQIFNDKVKIYYYIQRHADFILEMEILSENLEYNSYIECNEVKYCDLESPFNIIGNLDAKLIIETSLSNINAFDNLETYIKWVYAESNERKILAYINKAIC